MEDKIKDNNSYCITYTEEEILEKMREVAKKLNVNLDEIMPHVINHNDDHELAKTLGFCILSRYNFLLGDKSPWKK